MNYKVFILICVFIIGVMAGVKFLFMQKAEANVPDKAHLLIPDDAAMMSEWSDASRKAVSQMKEKYGEPGTKTSSMMIWENATPWKRIVVHARAVRHNFPMPHADVLEQTIDYKVPADKYSELARFDGSIVCSRTNGEISVRCDKDAMNFLALNLADDIIKGNKNAAAARDFHAKTALAFLKGIRDPYTQRLRFELNKENTADPDQMSLLIDNSEMIRKDQDEERPGPKGK